MIDLTPLDIRKKKRDFTRGLRGYDPQEVDHFLDLVAERLEELVKINLTLRERVDRLSEQTQGQEGRERAVQEALITAQSLKHDIQEQARREAELIEREAVAAADRMKREAATAVDRAREEMRQAVQSRAQELVDLNRSRSRFLKGFRNLLERELDAIEVAEANVPSDEFNLDSMEFGKRVPKSGARGNGETEAQGRGNGAAADEETNAGTDEVVEEVAEKVTETVAESDAETVPEEETEVPVAASAASDQGQSKTAGPSTSRKKTLDESGTDVAADSPVEGSTLEDDLPDAAEIAAQRRSAEEGGSATASPGR